MTTDGSGLRDGEDAPEEYRSLAQTIAMDSVTIDVGAVGSTLESENLAALADGSGGTVTQLEDGEKFESFLRSTVEMASQVIVPNPELYVEPGVGFTSKATIDGDETAFCRFEDSETGMQVVPPVTEEGSTTVVHLPELRAEETQRVLLPFLGSRQTPGMDHELASVRLLGRGGPRQSRCLEGESRDRHSTGRP